MIDKEKVIKALRLEIEHANTWDCTGECPYYEKTDCDCYTQVAIDALELLKDQMPVKPAPGMLCGECGCRIYQDANYCYNCGRPVKWDD